MKYTDKFLGGYDPKPASLEKQLEYATKELHHYLRPHHDMDFMKRQAIYYAQRVVELRKVLNVPG